MTLASLTFRTAPASLVLAAAASAVDTTRRTITGTLIPGDPNAVGATSAGPTRFSGPEAVTWHSDVSRVKLLREHDHSQSVGYATSLEWTTAGLVGSFYVPEGPAGDAALAEAANKTRDGLSVGVFDLTASYDTKDVLVVTGSQLREVSQVSVPAFDDSRITSVVASIKEGTRMFTEAQLAALRAAGIDPANTEAARTHLTSLTAGLSAPAAPATPPANLTAGDVADELMTRLTAGGLTLLGGPNAGPGTGGQQQQGPRDLTLAAFTELCAGYNRGDVTATQLQAALTDVVPANDPTAFRPAYLDELWNGSDYVRRFIDNAVTVKPLPRALKVVGSRWVTKPVVDDYAGNKGAVPSGPMQLEDIEVAVQRLAGAHDVDRAFIDLGSPAWFANYFEAMTESYRKKSDAKAASIAYAGATALTDTDASPATFSTVLKAVVAGVVAGANIGEATEYVALAPGLISELLNIANVDAPAFMSGAFQLSGNGDGNLGGLKFFTTPGLSGTQIMTGAKAGVRWHELPTPIRVQADNVAQGGVDLGVFGYYAGYVRNAQQVYKTTIGA